MSNSKRAWLLLTILMAAVLAVPIRADDARRPKSKLTDGMVGHWRFDGDTTDASGHGHHGSTWSTFAKDRSGVVNQALKTNGKSGFVTIADAKELDTVETLTVSVWVNPTNYVDARGDMGLIVSKWHTGSTPRLTNDNGQYYLALNTEGRLYCLWANYDSKMHFDKPMDWLTSETVVPKKQWTHVAVTFDQGRVTLYVGERRDRSKMSRHVTLTKSEFPRDDIIVGACHGRYFFDGAIDDLRIYDRALSAEEIGQLSGKR